MTKSSMLATAVLITAFGAHLQLQIDEIKERITVHDSIEVDAVKTLQMRSNPGGGPYMVADPHPEIGQAKESSSRDQTKVKTIDQLGESALAALDAYVDADSPPIDSISSEAQHIGHFMSVDDPSIYETEGSEYRNIGAFIDVNTQSP